MINSLNATSTVPLKSWPSLEAAGPEALAKARRELLNVVQWPARIANSFVSAKTEEERLTLRFCAARTGFLTAPFGNQLALEMRLPTLEMQFLENGKPVPHIFDPEEHSPAKVEAWLLVELLHRGIDRSKFTKILPYHIPDLMSGDAEDHSPQSCLEGLAILAAWFRDAASALEAAANTDGSKVLCRPQDLSLTCRAGPDAAGFGFSPGNVENPEPFFYRGGDPGSESRNASYRSILPASALLAERDPTAAVINFLKTGG